MKVIKKGLIYKATGKHGFDYSHCHKPTPLIIDENTVRVYFGARDINNKTRVTFVDLDSNDLSKVKYIHDKPILDLGKIGTFDDSGVNVSSVIRDGSKIYMYYIGVNTSTTVHMRNAIGVAVSEDNGFTFNRLYDGAILDRTKDEPYYTGAVDVIKEDSIWKCYYTCGLEWKIINNKPEIFYHIKYATSSNGIDWQRDNILCIPPRNELEISARPCVYKEDGIYKMLYSKRDILDFRTDKNHGYKAGYAESKDGIIWERKDEEFELNLSQEGWDSQAVAYPYLLKLNGQNIIFYNGNGFGTSGFGYAILEKEI